jgi:predicted metal-dependent HD superfamily phosphohydrolase
MNYHALLKKVQHYALDSFEQSGIGALTYHNQRHTESVVAHATDIANHYQLGERDFFIVAASAWLHDLGYSTDRHGHEEKGAEAAGDFLQGLDLPVADIDAVKGCILATKIPQDPHNLLEEIVCDADLFNLGTSHFSETNRMMRKEMEEAGDSRISKNEWRNKTIRFLEQHQYHSNYARQLLNDQKSVNLEQLKKKAAAKSDTSDSPAKDTSATGKTAENGNEETPSKQKHNRPERGVDTIFRVSSSNHQRLSNMADNKAHIMITVNSIILSAIISLLLRKLDQSNYLMIPTFIILATSLITIVFSVLATRPSIPKGVFTKKDLDEKTVNLLFFGNFYRMSLGEYKEGMEVMMKDQEFVYGSLIMDGYALGVVLSKKYRLLRTSYNVFMYGMIISVFAFIVASALYG